jgi:hypothetical protein
MWREIIGATQISFILAPRPAAVKPRERATTFHRHAPSTPHFKTNQDDNATTLCVQSANKTEAKEVKQSLTIYQL